MPRPLHASPLPCLLNRRHVDLPHRHHGFERAAAFITADGQRFGQHARRDLPVDAPLVLAPAAFALAAAVADDGIPVAVGLGLVLGRNLERKRLAVLERRAAVKSDARDAYNREVDDDHVARLA